MAASSEPGSILEIYKHIIDTVVEAVVEMCKEEAIDPFLAKKLGNVRSSSPSFSHFPDRIPHRTSHIHIPYLIPST